MNVILNRGYKYKIKPNKKQKQFLLKSFGCARKIYNYYVDSLYKQLEQQEYENGLIKNIKYDTPANIKKQFIYMKEIDSLALCNAQIDFKNAIKKFNKEYDKKSYSKRSKKRQKTLGIIPTFKDLKGMPKFKSIKNNDFSYKTNNQSRGGKWSDIQLKDKLLYIPKLKTSIKVVKHRDLPQNCIIKNATISMDYKSIFYVSLCVEYTKNIEQKKSEKVLGLDYSQHDFYVSSEGMIANYPKYYRIMQNKLKLEQQRLSRKILKSNNWYKQKKVISKIQTKIVNQRKDWLHKESTRLCDKFDAIIFEDIDLRGMGQCLHLGKNLSDNGFGMFRIYCKYKLEERGKQYIKIDKWYPSSKRCNNCGYIYDKLQLSEREWTCPSCRSIIKRDYNAALNIKEVGQTLLAW
ncbi:RNA-guided endonuclease InsQ/TnpB family protein [Clostridium sp. MT-14]|uniref:RNA-guided endonuclease InsQ/TnpB family protein n=1 Tax=Clostridium sp. MT-14 TaxID=3348360 RepID=UPI0035F2BFED